MNKRLVAVYKDTEPIKYDLSHLLSNLFNGKSFTVSHEEGHNTDVLILPYTSPSGELFNPDNLVIYFDSNGYIYKMTYKNKERPGVIVTPTLVDKYFNEIITVEEPTSEPSKQKYLQQGVPPIDALIEKYNEAVDLYNSLEDKTGRLAEHYKNACEEYQRAIRKLEEVF